MKTSFLEYLYEYSQSIPNKPCIIEKEKTVSYYSFWQMILSFAGRLKSQALCCGECVIVVASQTPSFLAAGFAIQAAGGIFVPVEKGIGDSRLQIIATLTSARIVVSEKAPGIDCVHILMEEIEDYMHGLDQSVAFPDGGTTSEILFTTGTTGDSKGVEMSCYGSLAVAENVIHGVKMKPDNVELIPVPINHSYGLRRCYANLMNGSTIVLMESVVFTNLLFEMMEKYKVTALALVPAAIAMILKLGKERIAKFSDQLDYIQIGTANLPECDKQALCELLPQSRLYNFYGSSEAGCSCIIDYNANRGLISCIGKPTINSGIIFVDEERREIPATRDNPGFLATSGKMLMKCYYKDPELTQFTMQDGYIYSHDMAYCGDDGNIYIIGRKDDVINIGGNKVSPSEIEEIVMMLDCIEDCACVPIEDSIAGQAPKLLIVIKPNYEYSTQKISQFLGQHLEAFKLPKIIMPIDKIPRTFNGKVQRNLLR